MAKNTGKSPERRAEIISALYRCIVKNGYLNTSVRDIAREANVKSGVIHYYFESKEEILEKLMEDIIEKYQQSFLSLYERHRSVSPRERLRLIIEFLFSKLAREKEMNRVFQEFWNLSHHDEKLLGLLKGMFKTYRAGITEHIAECFGELGVEYENIDALAAFLVGASEGVGLQLIIDSRGISVPKVSKVADQLINAIIGPDTCGQ